MRNSQNVWKIFEIEGILIHHNKSLDAEFSFLWSVGGNSEGKIIKFYGKISLENNFKAFFGMQYLQ